MTPNLICTWLNLPPDSWPPNHYQLLGLEPGETNAAVIEQHVQERLETLRRYQLIHPEPATEAMNRLAQAFVCLTDAESRRAYDAGLLQSSGARPGGPLAAVPPDEPLDVIPLDWNAAPPPRRLTQAEIETQIDAPLPTENTAESAPAPAAEKIDPGSETIRASGPARRGLGTKRALYHRVARTRQLIRAWDMLGRFLADPARRISKPAEATDLIQVLTTVRTLLRNFPPLLGVAGQPGYLVVSLARQAAVVPTFQTLLPSQREALSRDWASGRKLLGDHRQFLRQELRVMRKRSPAARVLRAIFTFVTDQPGMVLILLALLALNVALWRQHVTTGLQKLFRPTPTSTSTHPWQTPTP